MNPSLLVGIDLVFTVLLLVLLGVAVRGRGWGWRPARSTGAAVSAQPPSAGAPEEGPVVGPAREALPAGSPPDKTPDARRSLRSVKTAPPAGDGGAGRMAGGGRLLGEAVELKRQGLSPEQIARRLNASTGEVQMVLAFHRMESGNLEGPPPQASLRAAGTVSHVA